MVKKRYYRSNSNMGDTTGVPYYHIKDKEKEGNHYLFSVPGRITSKQIVDLLNEQDETIQELLKYKYLVKALEEVSRGDIGEIIYDYAGEGYENEKSQLELGKICSENGLEGWR